MQRIAVFGAGAVGCHIAARLVRSDVPVGLVARGATLEALRRSGLTLLEGETSVTVRVRAAARAAELGVQDLVIVTVKGTQIGGAVEDIHPLIGPETSLLIVMNGLPWWFAEGMAAPLHEALAPCLDPTGRLARLLPAEQVIWGVITAGAAVVAPGVVRSTTPALRRNVLGRPDDRADAAVRQVQALMRATGFDAAIAPRIRESIWSKLLLNAGQAMVATATDRDHLAVTSDPDTRGVVIALIEELVAIGAAIGLHPPADPWAMTDPANYGRHVPSFLQDLRAGRPLELDATILAARAIGRALHMPIPTLTTVAAIVAAQSADAARRRREAVDAGQLQERLGPVGVA
jgi:2-dehydropantoate 2-reductase